MRPITLLRIPTRFPLLSSVTCANAGIEVSSKGAHAFRHCFATRMLQEGHSLKAIADVLGHRHLATTFIYTKVDFNSLKASGPSVAAGGGAMKVLKLHSCLAPEIHNFHQPTPTLGHRLSKSGADAGVLRPFSGRRKNSASRALPARSPRTISKPSPILALRVKSNRFSVVRQLCKYLSRSDPLTHVPEPLRKIPSQAASQPYIYSETEVRTLLASASRLRAA